MDFHAQIVSQEWWSSFGFWLLVAGLIGEAFVAAVARPLGLEGKIETVAMLALTAVVAVGCAFEHVADSKVGALIAQEETTSGETIAKLGADEQNDRKIANQAASHAADLGVKVDQLPDFVKAQEAKIDGQFRAFQRHANVEEKRDAAALANFKAETSRLNIARDVAIANLAAESSRLHAAAIDRRLYPNRGAKYVQPPKETQELVKALKEFAGTHVAIQSVSDFEPENLARDLDLALTDAGWKVTVVDEKDTAIPTVTIPEGITVETDVYLAGTIPPPSVVGGQALADGLGKLLGEERYWPRRGSPVQPLPATSGVPLDSVFVMIGAKPSLTH